MHAGYDIVVYVWTALCVQRHTIAEPGANQYSFTMS